MGIILHSSFACDPYMGSEPYVGWKWASMVNSMGHDLHVLTRLHHKINIESDKNSKNIHFHYFDLPLMEKLDHRSRMMKPYYVLWQLSALFYALYLHYKYRYEIVHHITYNNIDIPGLLWLLPGAKFIWGPVGGGQIPPVSMRRTYGKKWSKEIIRKWLKRTAKYNPIIYLAMRKASVILFANRDTMSLVCRFKEKSHMMLETAIDRPVQQTLKNQGNKQEKFVILWVGRIEPRKALVLAIDAVNRVNNNQGLVGSNIEIILEVVGDGPQLNEMKAYVNEMGLQRTVVLRGSVGFSDVGKYYDSASVFLFTSVQDTSGNVLLEAMRHGLPCIALNHQGASEILKYGGGELISVAGTYEDVRDNISSAIISYIKTPSQLAEDGSKAQIIIKDRFTWEAKKQEVEKIYDAVLS